MRLVGSAEVLEGWMGSHRQQLKFHSDISAAMREGVPPDKCRVRPQAKRTRTGSGTQETSSFEKKLGFRLTGRDGRLQ